MVKKRVNTTEISDAAPAKLPKTAVPKKLKKTPKPKDTPKVQTTFEQSLIKTNREEIKIETAVDGEKKASFEKKSKFPSKLQKGPKQFGNGEMLEKPADWNEFKKKKKELRLKRRQCRNGFEVIVEAKKIGETLRRKALKGGEVERNKLINELHTMLKGQGHYPKFVLAHDTSRIVQWLLKFGSDIVKQQISHELIPMTIEMVQSKYGTYAVKRLLKYGNHKTRLAIIDAFYGHAVKLSSHTLCAPIFEYAFATWANPLQKQHLVQEFYGDLYKNSKDDKIKQLKDVFANSPDMKAATLGATKANLARVLNKNLLDSGLIQSVLYQFLLECDAKDRAELISQLAPHVVVISNSKDGARVAMQIIWHGTNKDRKVAMKALKEHVVELSKHEHGHCTILALLDTADDTVLLHKIILSEILQNVRDLSQDECGRKVLIWLVAPANPTYFHPIFINELENGRNLSTSKKSLDLRRKEILGYSINKLLGLIIDEPEFWLGKSNIALEMLLILKAGEGEELKKALESVVEVITNVEWTTKCADKDDVLLGVEDPGLHLVLKKLAQNDKVNLEHGKPTFGDSLIEKLSNDVLKMWLTLNRGCFLLIGVYENGSDRTQGKLKKKLLANIELLEEQKTAGAEVLLKKIS